MPAIPLLRGEELPLDGGPIAASFQINLTYAHGAPYQHAIELVRNVVHVHERMTAAGVDTSEVSMTFDFVQPEVIDDAEDTVIATPYKRRVWNIGTPMNPNTELHAWYAKLNVGGGDNRWSLDNLCGSYGMGARAAVLPWTDAMYLTTVPGQGTFGIVLRGTRSVDGQIEYSVVRPAYLTEEGWDLAESPLFKAAVDENDEDGVPYIRTTHGTIVGVTEALVHERLLASGTGGFTVIYLGKGNYADNIEFDAHKDETPRGMLRAVVDRFVGNLFPITTEYMFFAGSTGAGERVHQKARTLLDGTSVYCDTRSLKSLKDWTDRADRLEPINIDTSGTTITPYLLSEDYWHTNSLTEDEYRAEVEKNPKATQYEYRSDSTWGKLSTNKDEWLPFNGQGQVIVQFGEHEMYALREDGGGRRSRANLLSAWGISEERVARSTLLVIRPPVSKSHEDTAWGVTQNAARSNVTGPRGTNLPLRPWQAVFLDNFPEEIEKRLRVRPPSPTQEIPEDEIRRLTERAFGGSGGHKRPPVPVVADDKEKSSGQGDRSDGNINTSAGTGGHSGARTGTGTKESHPATPNPDGAKRITRRRTRNITPPQPRFLKATEWEDKGYPTNQFCRVSIQGSGYEIELNGGDEILENQLTYFWTDMRTGYFSRASRIPLRNKIVRRFGKARTVGAEEQAKLAVLAQIEYVYRHDALATFLGYQARCTDKDGKPDRERLNEEITNGSMAFTAALSGIYPQGESIKSRINGLGAGS